MRVTSWRPIGFSIALSVATCWSAVVVRGAELDPSRLPPAAGGQVDFEREIGPLLKSSCFGCHGPEKSKNGFRLDSRERLLQGGDNGVDVIAGDSARSPLVHYVAQLVPDMEMPPPGKGTPLTPEQIGKLRAWIDQGAIWKVGGAVNEAKGTTDKEDWWSWKPLQRPAVPKLPGEGDVIRNPIDAFILAKLAEKGMRPSAEADRRTLIRRLYFDLIGLPPTPEEIEEFVNDRDSQAYEHLVNRLLDSARYGERWARHWLDVVHYGETHGYDKDQPRTNAWPYRDYVIRSFNEDKPYARFVEEQLAGDVLFPDTRDGFEALGFIAAGPWDLIGHAEVPETKIDGKVARHLDRDDMVANTIQSFNSLTVQCAQCHNHKFDPIPQEDYYSLQAVFAAVDRADERYDVDPGVARERRALNGRLANIEARQDAMNERIRVRAGAPLADLEKQISNLEKTSKTSEAYGYHSAIEKNSASTKWVQVDLGAPVAIDKVVLHACSDDFNHIGDGFGFPVRFKVGLCDDAEFDKGVMLLVDDTGVDVPNPGLKPYTVEAGSRSGRYVRVTATKLAPRQDDFIFALAELEVLTAAGTNVARGAPVIALDSIESPARWQKVNLTDGWYPGLVASESGELTGVRRRRENLIAAATTAEEAAVLAEWKQEGGGIRGELKRLPAQSVAYVGAVYRGSGSFVGTGANGGAPRVIRVLKRGDVQKPGVETGPGALSCLKALPSRFESGAGQLEGERRAALARWITDARNPLTWRSIVNRVWLYHFGRGLVETPNDFGHMGALPSHPELLDWLAVEFRDSGQSLKALHRLIVTSAAYRQCSADNEAFAKLDSDNRFLWRMNRHKLEAEAVRDTLLLVSGKLDLTMGGPSFQDFVVEKPEHSPHYEYQLHDPDDPKANRRSIYRLIVRSQPQPFMTVLDCADPSMQVGRRNESLSPLQALALLNNSLVLRASKDFAAKLAQYPGDTVARVNRACYEALGRPLSVKESESLAAYAAQFGFENCCRVIFNLNEFAFVD